MTPSLTRDALLTARSELRQVLSRVSRAHPDAKEARARCEGLEGARLRRKVPVSVLRPGYTDGAPIRPGSGIVAEALEDGRSLVYAESGEQGAVNVRTYADRVMLAAERLAVLAPSSARWEMPAGQLLEVGYWDPELGPVVLGSDDIAPAEAEARVAEWLGVPHLPMEELFTTSGSAARRREWTEVLRRAPPGPVRRAMELRARRMGVDLSPRASTPARPEGSR